MLLTDIDDEQHLLDNPRDAFCRLAVHTDKNQAPAVAVDNTLLYRGLLLQ